MAALGLSLTLTEAYAGTLVTARGGGSSSSRTSNNNSGGTTLTRGGTVTLNPGSLNRTSISNVRTGSLNASSGTSLTKTGAGTLILSNAGNTYTGVTTVNSGAFRSGGSSQASIVPGSATLTMIGAVAPVVINTGVTFTGGATATPPATTEPPATLIGNLVLNPGTTIVPITQVPGPGTITLVGSGTVRFDGTIGSTNVAYLGSGTLILANAAALTSPLQIKCSIATDNPGSAFTDANPVTLITESEAGAAFPSGTAIRIRPLVQGQPSSSAVGTIANNTGVTLAIKASTLFTGGLMISRP